ncbi:hypothetical protein EI42_06385 [Thermosporothrix hazakensis]|jgi:hypothetical protein|uniref:Uncharacterized protein n=1 Tax=Thermosporothrix hazakensis TaxID=644383 RepID=A0A326TNX9_THEHA|nr:hypothetical protein EI42_06385 [Thermosporothrix hazakensis]
MFHDHIAIRLDPAHKGPPVNCMRDQASGFTPRAACAARAEWDMLRGTPDDDRHAPDGAAPLLIGMPLRGPVTSRPSESGAGRCTCTHFSLDDC